MHVPLPGGQNLPDLTEPNALTTLPRGITAEQLQAFQYIPDIAVAAPLAVVGYVQVGPALPFPADRATVMVDPAEPRLQDLEPGVFRLTSTMASRGAAATETIRYSEVVGIENHKGGLPPWAPKGLRTLDVGNEGALGAAVGAPTLVVGIDPAAEAQLTGINRAITDGRYLESSDIAFDAVRGKPPQTWTEYDVPILVNEHGFDGLVFTGEVEHLNQEMQPIGVVYRRTLTGAEIARAVKEQQKTIFGRVGYPLIGQAGPLTYSLASSPFHERWPVAVTLKATPDGGLQTWFDRSNPTSPHVSEEQGKFSGTYREWSPGPKFAQEGAQFKMLSLNVIGFFDASQLDVAKNPDSQMPLMTYRPASALQVLDAGGQPVNPPRPVAGGLTPNGFLSSPPIILTTLDAAQLIGGDGSINAIQVQVKGSEHFTPETVAHVRQVAAEIEQRTGLVAEVVMGSSPMNVLVHVPASNGQPDLGWFQEQWIHKDAAVTTVQQAEFGFSAFIALVLAVALLYAVATGLAGVTARRRELGVVTALGWPGRTLGGMAVGEQLMFAVTAGTLAALVAAYGKAAPTTIAMTWVGGLLVYLPALLATGLTAARISAGDALRWGDAAPGRRLLSGSGVAPLAVSSLAGRPGRTALTVSAISLPTALILVLTHISRQLNGVLYTTLTGQYAALKVGPLQYVAGVVGLAIAAVTTFDLIRQNAIDHRDERALLHALGWPRRWIATTMVTEGLLLGLAAGILGDLLGLTALTGLYGTGVTAAWRAAAVVWLLPVALGLLTGGLSALAELHSWDRRSLAGVSDGQVARWGRRSVAFGTVALVVLALAVAIPLTGQIAQRLRQEAKATPVSAEDSAVSAIKTEVAAQSQALQRSDMVSFLATFDPSPEAVPYRMEQQHWLEDAVAWRQIHPQGSITRDVLKISFLGTNTAVVRILQTARPSDWAEGGAGGSPPTPVAGTDTNRVSLTLNTVWVQDATGRWLEHGLQHEVVSQGDVTVWYEDGVSRDAAQAVAATWSQAAANLQKQLDWKLTPPIIIEIKADARTLRVSIGPHLAVHNDIPAWAEDGEPIRIAGDHILGLKGAYSLLVYKAVMDQSHNHAPDWLREALSRYALHRLAGMPLDYAIKELRGTGPLPLQEVPSPQMFFDRPKAEFERATTTAELLLTYLDQRYDPQVISAILNELAKQPVDPRMTGAATNAERGQAAVAAIEKATGLSWSQLNDDFQAWFKTLP